MKICIIAPVPDLVKFATLGDAHLMLTHLVAEGNDYTNFYKDRKELKVLDNGLFEHHVASPTSEIIAKARLTGAHVVIAPDILYDAKATVESTREFLEQVQRENGKRRGRSERELQVMAVPQADNRKDYLWCYKQLSDLGCEWIGLSILACPRSFEYDTNSSEVKPNRIAAYRALLETHLWNPKVNHHLLGLGTHIDEVEFFAPIQSVISNDSSSPIVHGQRGINYINGVVPGGKIGTKLDFSAATHDEYTSVVLENIQDWKTMARFGPQ